MTSNRTTHGQCGTLVYEIWKTMRSRCLSPKHKTYASYGGRGIKICERWNDFALFAADMGPKPDGFSIERNNNDGDYEPGNCRWASSTEQNNNKRSNHCVEVDGKRMTLAQAARLSAARVKASTLSARLRKGWDLEAALSRPPMSGKETAACRKTSRWDRNRDYAKHGAA